MRAALSIPVLLGCMLVLGAAASCSREPDSPEAPLPSTGSTVVAGGDEGEATTAPKPCEHGVPADLCTKCAPELAEVFKAQGDWCDEHGLPESHCRQCNPGLTFGGPTVPKDWCREHAVPESKCTKCHPRLVAKFVEAGDFCREHGYPESVCPSCHPELARAAGESPPEFPEPGTKIRLASPETVREAGIRTVAVRRRPFAPGVDVVGRVEFNQNRLAELSARGEAVIAEVKVDVGDEVRAGQPLVVLASAGVGEDQGRLVAAKARLEAATLAYRREEGLVGKGISARQGLERLAVALAEARADHDAARSTLSFAGASGGAGRYVLTAPFAGTVVLRDAVAGRTVAAGQPLIQVADRSTMWAVLEVPEEHALQVRAGQPVRITLEGPRAATREARVTRVSPTLDGHTRTVAVRVELDDRRRELKAGLFVRARIQTEPEHSALVVPRQAIERAQGRDLVFIRAAAGHFEPVSVRLGGGETEVEVLEGLADGAEVVTVGAFLLKTEILKDSIGAGCCGE